MNTFVPLAQQRNSNMCNTRWKRRQASGNIDIFFLKSANEISNEITDENTTQFANDAGNFFN